MVSFVSAVVLLAWVCLHAAGQVAVSRDGSLVFARPDNSSAVMDILSRGTVLELLEEGADWHRVRLSNNGGEGYIRADAISKTLVPGAYNPDSVRVGSPKYLELQAGMDQTEGKMRKIAGMLESLEDKLVRAEREDSLRKALAAGSRRGAGAAISGMLGYDPDYTYAISAFYGAYMENTDFAAGIAAAWFPGLPAGLGLELEAGAQFPEFVDNVYWGQFGVICPIGGWERVLPYIAGGGGVVYRKYTVGTTSLKDNNAIASAGGGLLLRIAGPVAVRADARYSWEFTEPKAAGQARVYLGATLLR
jgi:hypothetical protein